MAYECKKLYQSLIGKNREPMTNPKKRLSNSYQSLIGKNRDHRSARHHHHHPVSIPYREKQRRKRFTGKMPSQRVSIPYREKQRLQSIGVLDSSELYQSLIGKNRDDHVLAIPLDAMYQSLIGKNREDVAKTKEQRRKVSIPYREKQSCQAWRKSERRSINPLQGKIEWNI